MAYFHWGPQKRYVEYLNQKLDIVSEPKTERNIGI